MNTPAWQKYLDFMAAATLRLGSIRSWQSISRLSTPIQDKVDRELLRLLCRLGMTRELATCILALSRGGFDNFPPDDGYRHVVRSDPPWEGRGSAPRLGEEGSEGGSGNENENDREGQGGGGEEDSRDEYKANSSDSHDDGTPSVASTYGSHAWDYPRDNEDLDDTYPYQDLVADDETIGNRSAEADNIVLGRDQRIDLQVMERTLQRVGAYVPVTPAEMDALVERQVARDREGYAPRPGDDERLAGMA
jgi:hypothetical protein